MDWDDRLSVEEFAALPEEEGWRLELSRGRLIREPAPGPRHGHVAGRLYARLRDVVERSALGSRSDIRILAADEVREGEEVLPGFRLPLPELFG